MPVEKLYDGHQVASLFGVDYETVLHLAQTGEIRSVRIGRLRRFPESALTDYTQRNSHGNVIPFRLADEEETG